MIRTPPFPVLGDPGDWDDLTLLAATIFLEAEGEPPEGQLAVGYVIVHRSDAWGGPIPRVILGPDHRAWGDGRPWEAFSAWNDDYRVRALARLSSASDEARELAWRAAASAAWRLAPDPVPGAMFYLNVRLTLQIRGGRLPSWAADPDNPAAVDARRVVASIGRHVFLR